MGSRSAAVAERTVKLTENLQSHLAGIEHFFLNAGAPRAYDVLLDVLLDTVIPNLERFPGLGPLLAASEAGSIESSNAQATLSKIAGDAQVRQYILPDYLILYAVLPDAIHLLAIKHHRQLSFDIDAIWLSKPAPHA